MIKIYCNHNKQDVIHSFTIGQSFPNVQGKLLRVEIHGNELFKLSEVKELPLNLVATSYLVWHGKHAGRILNFLKSLFL
jgi:hypothetical protein